MSPSKNEKGLYQIDFGGVVYHGKGFPDNGPLWIWGRWMYSR